GTEPTITDANLVLGRLDPDDFLGGQMALDAGAAALGILEKIADPLKLSTTGAAQAIVDIAVAKMSLAVREVSVAKGYDLRYFGQEFTLSVPVTEKQIRAGDRRAVRAAFDTLYERRYAHHSPAEPVEIVNIRLAAIGKRASLALPRLSAKRSVKAHRKTQ